MGPICHARLAPNDIYYQFTAHRLIVVDHSRGRVLEGKKPRKTGAGNETLKTTRQILEFCYQGHGILLDTWQRGRLDLVTFRSWSRFTENLSSVIGAGENHFLGSNRHQAMSLFSVKQ